MASSSIQAQWAICNVKRLFPSLSFPLCHRDSALAVEDYVPWQALQGAKLVLQDYASGSRPLIDAALARNGIQANIVQEIGHPATLFPMVAAGIGISILPHWRYHCLKVAHWW
ncbi:LysR substrate-binding domain-containing protein [Escherichia coli]